MKGFNFHILKASEVSISKLFRDCLEYEELICTAASRTIYAVFSTRQPFDIPSRGFSLIMLQIFRYHMVEFSPFPKNNSHTTASFLRMAIWPAYNCGAKLEFVFKTSFQTPIFGLQEHTSMLSQLLTRKYDWDFSPSKKFIDRSRHTIQHPTF